jgi:hypothetical protein
MTSDIALDKGDADMHGRYFLDLRLFCPLYAGF